MARVYRLRGSCYLNRQIKCLPEVTRQNPAWTQVCLAHDHGCWGPAQLTCCWEWARWSGVRSCCEHSGDWPAPGIRTAVRRGYWAPVPRCGGGLESFPSLGARSHLGKWRHDEVLGIPVIQDRGRSGVRTVGRQRTWEWRGRGTREATLLGDTPWGPGPGRLVGREGAP